MRLKKLSLDLFGHFAGKSYDFGTGGAGKPDFHIVYGPNEAGKTTTMEAYLRLLYGFDTREDYDFQHQRKNLRVSGTLETTQGDLTLTRLPTRATSLVDANGTTLPEAAIATHLGGLTAADYRSLLCLDDETIEAGGEEIANSKGDIGRLLFSAAAGVADLTTVLDRVDTDASALYLKRSSKSEMAQIKKELTDVATQIKAQDVPASTYRKLRQTLTTATSQETEIGDERAKLMSQLAKIRTQQAALPLLQKLDQVEESIAPFVDYPDTLDVAPEDLVHMLTHQRQSEADITRLLGEVNDLETELSQIARHPDQLYLQSALADLDPARSRFATAQLDLPRRIETRDAIIADMKKAASELGAHDDPTQLIIAPSMLSQLEQTREAKRVAAQDLQTERDEVTRLTERLTIVSENLARTAAAHPDSAAIGELLDRFSADSLAPTYAKATEAIATAQRQLAIALASLSINGQSFNTLPPCAITAHDVGLLADTHSEVSRKIAQTNDEIDQLNAEIAVLHAQIEQMRSSGSMVDDATSDAEMQQRNALWHAHYDALNVETANKFEAALRRTDETAQQRFTQAKDIGQLRQATQNLAEIEARVEQVKQRLEKQQTHQSSISAQINDAAQKTGLTTAPTPAAFAKWVNQVEAAHAAQHQLNIISDENAAVLEKSSRLVAALSEHISLDAPDFDTLLAAARQKDKSARELREQRNAEQRTLDDLTSEQMKRVQRCDELLDVANNADKNWDKLVAECLHNRVEPDRLELSFEPLRTLRELDVRRMTAARQVDAMQADQEQFSAAMTKLAAKHGLNADEDPLTVFASLGELSIAAQVAETNHAALTTKVSNQKSAITDAQQHLTDINRKVAELGKLFPKHVAVQSVDDLRHAVAKAKDVISARREMDELTTQIIGQLDLPDITEARTALENVSPAILDAQSMQLQGDLDELETRYRQAIAARAEAAKDLQSVTDDNVIAELAERKTTLELAMQDIALQYVELRAGHMLAQEAIRRYRDTHRSSMMNATQLAFSELTNGAYTALQTQPDGANETLIAIDAAGRAKQAQDMSKGTRFQLYLALRAAAYEQLASQGTCLPFFCDDIFETFDEERTKAACKMMERIGRRGQAIYLTHHQHVVDIARDVCGDSVRVHEI
ncbi:YhaN family protein [Yoonia maritima]|uniref:YhaN family protein n=1 Tax=Yoonia maritima TaxID=1435347 RepID=UPI000D10F9FB|nr:YhaN family protein [Yoonia maritima]